MRKKKTTDHQDPFSEREAQRYERPIPSREYILEWLVQKGKPIKQAKLARVLGLTEPTREEALHRRLNAMVRECQLVNTPEGYTALTILKEIHGSVSLQKDGFGVVTSFSDGQQVKILPREIKGYYEKDEVIARVTRYSGEGIASGNIVKLIQANDAKLVGRFNTQAQQAFVVPLEKKYPHNILVKPEMAQGATEGDIVVVKIIRDITQLKEVPCGEVLEVLGGPQTQGIEIETAIRKFQLPQIWPQAVIKQAQAVPETVPVAATAARQDLRALPLVTIDGEDAKDFDDAVCCVPRKRGGWRLWVAIADVSHYVKPGSPLDQEAKLRGNSVYFPGHVIPMLPEKLSNGLCSLKPQVDRLALVCEMVINPQGKVTRYEFSQAVICSHARLTYTEVYKMLEVKDPLLQQHYAHVLTPLQHLHAVYQALHLQRQQRGAIDFETVDTQILFDKAGKIEHILPTQRNIAHKMIEECMLAANVSAARFLLRYKAPALFRNHPCPPEEKLMGLRNFLAELGLDLGGGSQPSPKDYANLVKTIGERTDAQVVETVLLRSLSQAEYAPKNEGHFGLAYAAYLHFTSPIRRYPDLLTHRKIIDILQQQPIIKDQLEQNAIAELGRHCSMTERRADEATRDAIFTLKCDYMRDKVGEVFQGRITAVTSFGLFVQLQDLYIEGLVHVATLGDEYFYYEPFKHRMIGERTRYVFKLGDVLPVQVIKVDIEDKKIDLEIVSKPDGKQSSAPAKTTGKTRERPRRNRKPKNNAPKRS
jgi:ribonuclease R